jgi:hypothetical protein
MSRPKVIIAGGGISGLVANWELRDRADVVVMEPGKMGGEFTAGGLKYIHRTGPMENMFDQLELSYSTYIVRGGILLRGQMYLYPQVLQGMDPKQAARIQQDHYRKTRRTSPGEGYAAKAMNDPAATGPRRALRCDFEDLIEQLADQADTINSGVARVDHERNVVFDMDGRPHRYDFLIMTIPLWITRRVCSFYVPEARAMRLNTAHVFARTGQYASFDYVYTPYTPADMIHRFSPRTGGYSVETNGTLDHDQLKSDLAFIFSDGYVIESVREGLKGHLLALPEPVRWPDNVAPIGRFSSWDPRSTTDTALEDAMKLKERWL